MLKAARVFFFVHLDVATLL